VFATGQGRKTDATDEHSVALVCTRMAGLRPVVNDEQLALLRILAVRAARVWKYIALPARRAAARPAVAVCTTGPLPPPSRLAARPSSAAVRSYQDRCGNGPPSSTRPEDVPGADLGPTTTSAGAAGWCRPRHPGRRAPEQPGRCPGPRRSNPSTRRRAARGRAAPTAAHAVEPRHAGRSGCWPAKDARLNAGLGCVRDQRERRAA
jgi:hypothetical protein